MITKRISQIILVLFLTFTRGEKIFAFSFEEGRDIFNKNCIACHQGGNNMVIPEKNLKKLTLKANGIFDKDAIIYQVLNGKNGMHELIQYHHANLQFLIHYKFVKFLTGNHYLT